MANALLLFGIGISGTGSGTAFDPDAQSYITAVETADGQSLEDGVKTAINNFVVGCKSDGIWDFIKASAILAGARTLTGALVPLKGTAPTNNNFVSGDYNRKTGLVGDGSSKYLNSNRNNNADPQDDQHLSVWVSTATTSTGSTFPIYIGAGALGVEATFMGRLSSNGDLYFRSRDNDYEAINPGSAVGLIGLSRSSSSFYTSRVAGVNANQNRTSQVPTDRNIFVFAATADPDRPSNGRLSFYSIGEALDLALLDTRVSQLMTDIDNAIPYDADAVDYFNRVEGVSGDNQELEPAVKTAINDFIVGCKADGVWNAIKSSAILAGARTLTGALQPLKGTAPTNNNFVSGDYNRKTGLVGDGSTKYLNSNRNNNADPQDNKHLSVFASTSFDSTVIGAFDGVSSNGASWLARDATTTYVRLNAGSSYSTVEVAATGFVGASRSSSSTISRRVFGTTTPAINQNSVIPSNTPVTVFRQGLASQFSNSRLAFYSIGESLNLALLDTRVSQLMTDLNNIIP